MEQPKEFPKPEKKPEIPGKRIPDTPVLPPDKPEIIPEEKPEKETKPPEVPKHDK